MSPRQWPGITPENWCILSDAPRVDRDRRIGGFHEELLDIANTTG